MAFFKRVQKKVNDLWYPQSVTWGKAVTTREVADELSVLSTVTRGDTYAVMENLGRVLSNFMGQGRTVKINWCRHLLLYCHPLLKDECRRLRR